MSASLAAFDRPRAVTSNTVFKSGPLFISSKGIGWKSWKKRWFILTRTSLVFFKNDPNALPQKGGEVNLTLGGIDLNNSGSVVVREDKKLLTVLFPDGRDGRAFTLKAETSEDLFEWKTALEQALAQAPSAALVMGHNGIFRNDTTEQIDGSFNPWRDKHPFTSLVVGRPILLALEDIDGGPAFLEKALRFLEMFGTKVEGILRQSADVEEVERRVQEYEQGKNEFGPDEDAHVVGDCVKHVLRELPSSPVPASCCTALLEAYKIDRKQGQINGMRAAILDTFPEPNRHLLQRVLKMMHTVACHTHENRMTSSAVAACMAPLLLRPLLAGECELDDDFDVNGDDSAQLLAAANAANNAQAIVTILTEEYSNIFDSILMVMPALLSNLLAALGTLVAENLHLLLSFIDSLFQDENLHRCSISADSRLENSRSEDSSSDENMDLKDNGYHDAENEVDQETDDDHERVLSGKLSESSGSVRSDLYDYKPFGGNDVTVGPSRKIHTLAETTNVCVDPQKISHPNVQMKDDNRKQMKETENPQTEVDGSGSSPASESYRLMGDILNSMDPGNRLTLSGLEPSGGKPVGNLMSANNNSRRSAFWGRSTPRKTPSMESVESSGEEELVIQRLEITKNDLQNRIAKEARGNAILQASLERRKQALHERQLALEQDVSRLQEQLQAERDLRAALEVGLSMSSGQFNSSRGMDSKTRAELEEIALAEADVARLKQKVAELHNQLNQQRQHHYGSLSDASDRYQHVQNHNSQVRFLQQNFDKTLAFVNNERKQRAEESLLGGDWRNFKGLVLASASSSKQASRKQFMDPTSLSDCRSTEASTSMSMEELCTVDSASVPSTSKTAAVLDHLKNTNFPSSALVELTTRLDFFKERRSQLMEQLHNLDLNYGNTSSQDFAFRSSSPPPWN